MFFLVWNDACVAQRKSRKLHDVCMVWTKSFKNMWRECHVVVDLNAGHSSVVCCHLFFFFFCAAERNEQVRYGHRSNSMPRFTGVIRRSLFVLITCCLMWSTPQSDTGVRGVWLDTARRSRTTPYFTVNSVWTSFLTSRRPCWHALQPL